NRFDQAYYQILKELRHEKIFFILPAGLHKEQKDFVSDYFEKELLPALVPVLIDEKRALPELKDRTVYFLIRLSKKENASQKLLALIELPANLSRFLILPFAKQRQNIMMLDDVIRYSLPKIF